MGGGLVHLIEADTAEEEGLSGQNTGHSTVHKNPHVYFNNIINLHSYEGSGVTWIIIPTSIHILFVSKQSLHSLPVN